MTIQEWKDRAQEYSVEVGCPDDLWDEDDPYDLADISHSDYAAGRSPEDFIRAVFAEDLAAMEGDEQSFSDSLNSGLDE